MNPYRGVVEIRIHGVSGTPPEELLDRSPVRQIAGDGIAGFYRPVLHELKRDRPNGADTETGPWLEGYSWGGWTSGVRTRAFWILLLPFALVNVAPRMIPPRQPTNTDPDSPLGVTWRHRLTGGVFRMLALSLTSTIVLGITDVSIVTIARRCSDATATCAGIPTGITGWLANRSDAWQVGICALIPLAAVGVLWRLSRTASRRYEDVEPEPDAPSPVRPDDDQIPLTRRDMWRGSARVSRLRLLHVQCGIASVIGIVAFVFGASGARTACLAGAVVALMLTLTQVAIRPSNDTKRLMLAPRLTWIPIAYTAISAAVMLVGADATRLELRPDTMVIKLDGLVSTLFVGQAVGLLLVLILLTLLKIPKEPKPTPRPRGVPDASELKPPELKPPAVGPPAMAPVNMFGYAAFVFAFIGWLAGSMYTAALLVLAPIWLFTKGAVPGPGTISTFLDAHRSWFGRTTFTTGIGMAATALVIAILLVLFLACVAVRMTMGGALVDRKNFSQDYPGVDAATLQERDKGQRIKSIRQIFWQARRVDYAAKGLGVFCVAMVIFLAVQGWAFQGDGSWAGVLAPISESNDAFPAESVVAWGVYFTVVLLLGIIALAVASYRTASARRGVGILWDLTCFWPRDVHPFAPPCYTERIVPEVSRRMKAYLVPGDTVSEPDVHQPDPPGAILLAAHSQGTVIGVAVLLAQPEDFPKDRVALLTFGSVLDRLYARFFPRYFSPAVFGMVTGHLTAPDQQPRWINLWRHSDYLGGSVPYPLSRVMTEPGPENVRVIDPIFDTPSEGIIPPPAGRHSGFWRDSEFQAQVGVLMERLGPEFGSMQPGRAPVPPFPEAPTTIR